MVMGITGQDRQPLPRAQANTEVEHPDEAVGKGRRAQGQALERPGRFDPDEAESHDPIDAGLRAWRFLDAKSPHQEMQDARDGAKVDMRHAQGL
jgi:hypothetical protein